MPGEWMLRKGSECAAEKPREPEGVVLVQVGVIYEGWYLPSGRGYV